MEEDRFEAAVGTGVDYCDRPARGILKAPIVTATASARKEPSRIMVFGPSASPGPKQPQSICRPIAYERIMTAKNKPRSRLAISPNQRSAMPESTATPSASSHHGKIRAIGSRALSGRILYEFRDTANCSHGARSLV